MSPVINEMDLYGGDPLGSLPKIAALRVTVEFTDGTAASVEVGEATRAVLGVETEPETTDGDWTGLVLSLRRTLVLRVLDPGEFTVTIPRPPASTNG